MSKHDLLLVASAFVLTTVVFLAISAIAFSSELHLFWG